MKKLSRDGGRGIRALAVGVGAVLWQLRRQYTSYDAAYLALAEALDAPLCTCDAKLNAGGHDATIRLVRADGC